MTTFNLIGMRDLRAYELARLADCGSPDTLESPGAKFLGNVRDCVAEACEEGYWSEDQPHEIADSAVPVYTGELWAVFVDLAAYNEDPSDFGEFAGDMTREAGTCLYLIADRLAHQLVEDFTDAGDESGEEG